MLKNCNLTISKHISLELGLISERWNSFNVGAVCEGWGGLDVNLSWNNYIIYYKKILSVPVITAVYEELSKLIGFSLNEIRINLCLQNLKRNQQFFLKSSSNNAFCLRRPSFIKDRELSPCFWGHLFWPLEGLWTFKNSLNNWVDSLWSRASNNKSSKGIVCIIYILGKVFCKSLRLN